MSGSALKLVPLDFDQNSEPDIELEIPQQPHGGSGSDAVIIGLTSAVGGTGVTTIAIEMAYQLARQKPSARTALMSLDFENCALAHYLDAAPKVTIEHFCQAPRLMEFDQCQSWMTQTSFGFDTLALPISVDGNQRVNGDSVVSFLDLMSQNYDYLILDIPRLWNAWTHASLGAADKIAMVCELNIPSLHLTRERCNGLVKSIGSMAGIEVILNKFERRSMRNVVKFLDAEKTFPMVPIHQIRFAREIVRDALNRGEPLSINYRGSKPAGDISQVLNNWLANMADLSEAQSLSC